MGKKFFVTIIVLLTFACTTFACCCNGKKTFAASNKQKACQNIFSFITIDLSIFSPRATAADVHVGTPNQYAPCPCNCCTPQTCVQPCPPRCSPCNPQYCPCVPQCCPCNPQYPGCRTQSMEPAKEKGEIAASTGDGKGTIIPVADKQEIEQPDTVTVKKRSLFRIGIFNPFKK